ncbi:MAG: amidohydrolase family protein, partial [Planctomycetes bacterium]|nr:amidohydrolase family protein [Planctomycetota bacterium]
MRNSITGLLCLFALLLFPTLSCLESTTINDDSSPILAERRILLQKIRIFDVHSGVMSEPRDLLINGSLIADVDKQEHLLKGKPQIIDCNGKYALPGLFDCHTHIAHLAAPGEERIGEGLSALVFSGITQVRDVGGPIDVLSMMSKRIAQNEIRGPEIFYSGPMLEQSPLTWGKVNEKLPGFTVAIDDKKTLEALIPELSWKGARLIKTFNKIEPDIFQRVIELARVHGLKVAHDPGSPLFNWIPMDKAIDMGITSIEHAKAPWPSVLKDDLQAEHDKLVGPEKNEMFQQMFMMKVTQMGTDSISPEKLKKLAEKMKEKGAFLCPTLNVFFGMYEMALEQVKMQQQLEEIPEPMKAMIKQGTSAMEEVSRFFVREFTNYGVKLLVGQDGLTPEGFFKEIRCLKECGVSEVEILRGATLYPAQWLGVDDRLGSLEPGKQANILVVNGNPLEEIGQTASTFLVLKE